MKGKILIYSIILFFLASCNTMYFGPNNMVAKPVRRIKHLDQSMAYIYGHFSKQSENSISMYIQLKQINARQEDHSEHKIYLIPIKNNRKITMVKLPAGEYQFSDIKIDHLSNANIFNFDLPIKFRLAPGQAYFIGDYELMSSKLCDDYSCSYRWQVTQFTPNYALATKKLLKRYPWFKNIDTNNYFYKIASQIINNRDKFLQQNILNKYKQTSNH